MAPSSGAVDLRDAGAVRTAMARWRPRIVLHAAGFTDVDGAASRRAEAFAVNGVGTGHVATACAALDVPLVFLSTDHVFDGRGGAPYAPEDPLAPVNAYAASKAEGERRVQASGCRAAIVRTAWLHGPDGEDFVGAMAARARRGPIWAVADQRGHPTPVDGLARWLLALCDDAPSQPWTTWHAAGTPAVDRATWLETVLPWATVRRTTTDRFPTPARRPRDARLDTSAADAAYGPIHWRDTRWHVLRENNTSDVSALAFAR